MGSQPPNKEQQQGLQDELELDNDEETEAERTEDDQYENEAQGSPSQARRAPDVHNHLGPSSDQNALYTRLGKIQVQGGVKRVGADFATKQPKKRLVQGDSRGARPDPRSTFPGQTGWNDPTTPMSHQGRRQVLPNDPTFAGSFFPRDTLTPALLHGGVQVPTNGFDVGSLPSTSQEAHLEGPNLRDSFRSDQRFSDAPTFTPRRNGASLPQRAIPRAPVAPMVSTNNSLRNSSPQTPVPNVLDASARRGEEFECEMVKGD